MAPEFELTCIGPAFQGTLDAGTSRVLDSRSLTRQLPAGSGGLRGTGSLSPLETVAIVLERTPASGQLFRGTRRRHEDLRALS